MLSPRRCKNLMKKAVSSGALAAQSMMSAPMTVASETFRPRKVVARRVRRATSVACATLVCGKTPKRSSDAKIRRRVLRPRTVCRRRCWFRRRRTRLVSAAFPIARATITAGRSQTPRSELWKPTRTELCLGFEPDCRRTRTDAESCSCRITSRPSTWEDNTRCGL